MTSSRKARLLGRGRGLWISAAACLLVPAVAQAEEGTAGSPPAQPPADTAPAKPAADTAPGQTPADTAPAKPAADIAPAKPAAETAPAQPPADTAPAKPAAETAPAQTPAASPRRTTAVDSLPGSSTNPGVGMSPEAPPVPPAPGGRAPSFGAPADKDAWVFRLAGRISGWEQLGIGRRAEDEFPTKSGAILHTQPLTVGKVPIWAGPGGTLNFQYGSQTIMAFASVEAWLAGSEYSGYYRDEYGPRIRTAYLAATPAPIGDLRLRFQVGAFPSNYGAPGQWGWGIFGPALAINGYGGTATANLDLGPRLQLYLEYGISGVPAVDEAFVRGTYANWPENGVSSIVNHVHVGISRENKYFAKLHLAQANGRDMRKWLDVAMPATPSDGTIRVAALELRWVNDPYGQLGVTPVYWEFDHALSVHGGIWWGLDWTAGGREMTRKFLGPQSNGTGKIVAVSAEYDFSVSRILRSPEPFDGNGRDLRVSLAFLPFMTVSSQDPNYEDTKGYYLGATLEYVLFSWFSTMAMVFGESRSMAMADVSGEWTRGRWASHSATAALVLHSDWQSQDRIVLAYSRYFYTNFADNNPARPLDRDVLTLGASVAF
jgi:hypothetical protein